jgi:hypothetical protein
VAEFVNGIVAADISYLHRAISRRCCESLLVRQLRDDV